MMGGKKNKTDQALDDEDAAQLKAIHDEDKEIDEGVDDISAAMDRLAARGAAMGEETKKQNKQLEKMGNSMQTAAEKQVIVNQRLKRQLK
mgnify:FL=1